MRVGAPGVVYDLVYRFAECLVSHPQHVYRIADLIYILKNVAASDKLNDIQKYRWKTSNQHWHVIVAFKYFTSSNTVGSGYMVLTCVDTHGPGQQRFEASLKTLPDTYLRTTAA